MSEFTRKYPIGAECVPSGVHFRVWAPKCTTLNLVCNNSKIPLEKENNGYFSLFVKDLKPGMLYQFQIDNDETLLADPASKYQPEGPHGPSCIVDPSSFHWQDASWKGIPSMKGQSLYELHVGTFTKEGTWKAALKKLPDLVDLGITAIEMMPVAEWSGKFGWGYDGVNLFAPTRLYGTPDDLKEFINQAHLLGLGLILDVVYNHFGPNGNNFSKFSDDYLTHDYKTDWGHPINFEGKNSKPVREFFLTNALYWIEEFHFDGLRLDAVQNIYDHSDQHILKEMSCLIHGKKLKRATVFIGENESQEIKLLEPRSKGGYELDAVWNDDFHHSALVRLTGRREAYYVDYLGHLQEFLSSIKYGYLFQGQYYNWHDKLRGDSSLNIAYEKFILFLENHDQIANSTRGERIHIIAEWPLIRLMTTLLILSPQVPLLFQGQEWGASTPFYYFADHEPLLGKAVSEGRKVSLSRFASFNTPNMDTYYLEPNNEEAFLKSKLDWEEKTKQRNKEMYHFHRSLLRLRKEDAVFTSPLKVDGAVMNPDVLIIRFFGPENDDRLLICNFGPDCILNPIPEPLLAPPKDKKWEFILSSEALVFGGSGFPPIDQTLKAHSTTVFKSAHS